MSTTYLPSYFDRRSRSQTAVSILIFCQPLLSFWYLGKEKCHIGVMSGFRFLASVVYDQACLSSDGGTSGTHGTGKTRFPAQIGLTGYTLSFE
ncbi:hypothetical protein Hypma_008725 [Hypsizygus marmoreus]|uniref:Uncharacterized protein n=1 Tax=Hypsizygus marmoreus TaxID=39966 RepID=A0A369JSB3_HYPMA|nr:hypothetical protein Hypma_008725 [Hypsizygus marmoreus]